MPGNDAYLPPRRQVSPALPALPAVAAVCLFVAIVFLVSQLPRTMVPGMGRPIYFVPALVVGIGLVVVAVVRPEIPFLVLVFLAPLDLYATFFRTHRIGGGVSITGIKVVGIIAAGGWLLRQIVRLHSGGPRPHFGKIGGCLGLYMLAVIVSLFFTQNLFQGWYKFIMLIQLFAFFFLAVNFIETERMLLATVWVFLAATAVSSVMAILQRIGVIPYAKVEQRATGAQLDPNYFALSLAMAVFLGIGMFLASRARSGKLAALGVSGLTGIAMVLSMSRGGIVAFVAAVLYMLVRARRWNLVFLTILVVAALVPFVPQELYERFSPDFIARDVSAQARLYSYIAAVKMWARSPLIGIGQGSFMDELQGYMPVHLRSVRIVAHNTYLEILAENGIFGFAGFVGALALSFRTVRRVRMAAMAAGEHQIANLTYGVELAFFAMLVGNLFLSSQTQKQVWLMFGIIAALGYLAAGWRAGTDTAGEASGEHAAAEARVAS